MKHSYAFSTAFVIAPEAQGQKAEQPVRGRNPKMDLFLRKVNGSARYSPTSIEARMAKVPEQGKTVA